MKKIFFIILIACSFMLCGCSNERSCSSIPKNEIDSTSNKVNLEVGIVDRSISDRKISKLKLLIDGENVSSDKVNLLNVYTINANVDNHFEVISKNFFGINFLDLISDDFIFVLISDKNNRSMQLPKSLISDNIYLLINDDYSYTFADFSKQTNYWLNDVESIELIRGSM